MINMTADWSPLSVAIFTLFNNNQLLSPYLKSLSHFKIKFIKINHLSQFNNLIKLILFISSQNAKLNTTLNCKIHIIRRSNI